MLRVNKADNLRGLRPERLVSLHRLQSAGEDNLYERLPGRGEPERELRFRELAAILRRRASLLSSIIIAGTLIATIVGLLIPPKYTATAQLLVDAQPGAATGSSSAATMDEIVDTHVTLVNSREHLQHVIDSLLQIKNANAAAHNGDDATVAETASSNVTASPVQEGEEVKRPLLEELRYRLGIWLSGPRRSLNRMVPSIDDLEHNIRINQERRSRVISVAFTAANAVEAALVSNRVVQLYVDDLQNKSRTQATAEVERIDGQIESSKNAMKAANLAVQAEIQAQLSAPHNESGISPNADERLRELKRNAQASAQIFGNLLRRQRELGDVREAALSGISVHSLASVPDRPSSHNPLLFIFPAFILFAIGGSWLAIALDKLDDGLHGERETSNALGVPCIGLVPMKPRTPMKLPWARAEPVAEPHSSYHEAIRSVVATLQLECPVQVHKVVLISSSLPGEGKSTLAHSLAEYYSSFGNNVLLIHLESRRQLGQTALHANHTRENAGTRQPVAQFRKSIFRAAEGQYDCLSELGLQADLFQLCAQGQFSSLMQELRATYDVIFIDGPAVFESAEARLLPSLSDKILFAIAWGSTRRDIAQNALELLCGTTVTSNDRQYAPIAILTKVNLKEHVRYRFGDVGALLAAYKAHYASYSKRSWSRDESIPTLAASNEHPSVLEQEKDATAQQPS